jgi:hypothetical protein
VLETPAEANCGFGVSVTRWNLSVETTVVMTHGDCELCASQQQSTKDATQQQSAASEHVVISKVLVARHQLIAAQIESEASCRPFHPSARTPPM